MKTTLLLIFISLMLSGCGKPATTGNYREYNSPITIRGNHGHVVLVVPITVDAMSETEQTTDQTSKPVIDLNLQLPKILGAAKSALDDLVTLLPAKDKEVEEIILPVIPEPEEIEDIPPPTSDGGVETGRYHGRHNGDRPTWYFSKNLSEYGKDLLVRVPGCFELLEINHNGVRYESGGVILKQSDVAGRGAALILPSSCKGTVANLLEMSP